MNMLFALSAGLLLFVSTGPLMAHMHEERPVRSIPALVTGVVIALAIAAISVPHLHNVEDHSATHAHPPFN